MSDPTADRLQLIQADLAAILGQRLAELNSVVRETETLTRRILSAEMELERGQATAARLRAELAEVEAKIAALDGDNTRDQRRLAALQAEAQDLAAEADG